MSRRREDRGEATRRGPGAKEDGGESTGSAGVRPVPAVALDRFGLLCAVLAAVGFSGKAILVKASEEVGLDRQAYFLPATGGDYAAYRRFFQSVPAGLR